jgi:hypothetical protein
MVEYYSDYIQAKQVQQVLKVQLATAIGPVISSSKFARLTVTSAGAGSTLTYVGIRAL